MYGFLRVHGFPCVLLRWFELLFTPINEWFFSSHIDSKQVFYTFVKFFFYIIFLILLASCFSFTSSCYCHIRLLRGISSVRARVMLWLSCYPVCQFDLLSQLSPFSLTKIAHFPFPFGCRWCTFNIYCISTFYFSPIILCHPFIWDS